MASPQLLHIEDDAPLRRSVLLTLADEGFEVLQAADGRQGLQQLDHVPDGVLLDLGLPDIDGFELCGLLRQRTPNPLLILSVQRAPDDVARALAAGADDVLVKPVAPAELARRFRALILPAALSLRGVTDDPTLPGSPVDRLDQGAAASDLTVVERRLCAALSAQPGQAVDRNDLLRRVWGVPPFAGAAALFARVHSLGVKLQAAGGPSISPTATGYVLHA